MGGRGEGGGDPYMRVGCMGSRRGKRSRSISKSIDWRLSVKGEVRGEWGLGLITRKGGSRGRFEADEDLRVVIGVPG